MPHEKFSMPPELFDSDQTLTPLGLLYLWLYIKFGLLPTAGRCHNARFECTENTLHADCGKTWQAALVEHPDSDFVSVTVGRLIKHEWIEKRALFHIDGQGWFRLYVDGRRGAPEC